jgi:sigma-B regulation protein RsbU (phosphoserine phosphatase)
MEQFIRATADKERISAELSLATEIQASMLPHVFPPFPDRKEIDLYASMDPAREVGGDFYDFFLIDVDHLGIVIADVSGKGVPAALFMMESKIILENNAAPGRSPAEILAMTNETICANNTMEMFVSVWLGILELSTGKLRAANAGHEYPVITNEEGEFELLKDKHGLVIGAMEGMRFRNYEVQLAPGTKLFVYTDGVPEATDANDELFGNERMVEALNRAKDAPPQEILRRVRMEVDEFVGEAEQFDDLTMLCLEYKGADMEKNELLIDAKVDNLPQVLDYVNEYLENHDCSPRTVIQVGVVVEEIFVNIASYAYGPEGGSAGILANITGDPAVLILTFRDQGMPYNPLEKEDPDITLSAEEREIGGLGIFMTKQMMDDVAYEYKDGQNILTLTKNL